MIVTGALPISGHTMRVTLDRDTVCLTPVCHEPDGAKCRVTCAADNPCDDFDYPEHECGLKPVDYCNAVEYMNGDGWVDECYGPDDEIPIYDGMPIEVEWDGTGYTWSAVKISVTTP